jgi:hypothetical protein
MPHQKVPQEVTASRSRLKDQPNLNCATVAELEQAIRKDSARLPITHRRSMSKHRQDTSITM